jgi:signal transduction histidine kinase
LAISNKDKENPYCFHYANGLIVIFILKKIVGLIINCLMLKKHSFLVVFILLGFSGFTQTLPDSSFIDIASINDSANITKNTFLFFDSNNVANPENITQQKFIPLTSFSYNRFISRALVSKNAYLQIALSNSGTASDTVFLFPGSMFDKIIFYESSPGTASKYGGDGTKSGFCKLILAPAERKIIIVKLKFCRQEYNYLRPQLIQTHYLNTYNAVSRTRIEDMRNIGLLLSGILLMMIVFIIVNYTLTPKKEFLYYLGYAVCMFLLVLFFALLGVTWGGFTSFFIGYFDLFLLITGNVFYLAFTRHFLNTKSNYKILDNTFKAAELFLLFLLLVFTAVHYFTQWYLVEYMLENLMKIIVLAIGILFIVIAFKQKQRLIIYLAAGSAFAIFFSLISLFIILFKIPTMGIFSNALFYYDIGLVFALSFFLLGLTYKNRKEIIERTKEQEALKLDVEKKVLENQIAIIQAQQEERSRISADMHDDLGAGMTTIRLYSELAKGKLADTPMPEIDKISSSANELLNKMNAIIWSMSSSNDSLGNMVAYVRSYSLEYFENTGIDCRITIPENLPNIVIGGEVRRNVFLVVKEALNNVLKHSKATEVAITLELVPGGLKLLIQDNGVGIDLEKLRQFGNGLKNMKKRMEDIDAEFFIENNNGTLVTLFGLNSAL